MVPRVPPPQVDGSVAGVRSDDSRMRGARQRWTPLSWGDQEWDDSFSTRGSSSMEKRLVTRYATKSPEADLKGVPDRWRLYQVVTGQA